jgi:recombination protein RecT
MGNQLLEKTNGAQTNQQAPGPANNTPATVVEATIDSVLNKVAKYMDAGELLLPQNYSPNNAVRSAFLALQDLKDKNNTPVLQSCTKESIINALYDMVTKGLSYTKGQCYFIPYGNKLSCDESYLGKIAIAKRDSDVKDVSPMAVYNDDEFEYEINMGKYKVLNHKQLLKNIAPDKLVGAYAIIEYNDGSVKTEIMTMDQIRKAWEQGPMRGKSPAHVNFPDQMAMKTVITRGLKIDIGSSDDSSLFLHREDAFSANVQERIKNNANKTSIGFPSDNRRDEDRIEDAEFSVNQNTDQTEPVQAQHLNSKAQTLGPGF